MSTLFSSQREQIAGQLKPLLEELQGEMEVGGGHQANVYELLLEVAVKLALTEVGRIDLSFALARYSEMVAGDLISNAMAIDEMPELE